MKKIFLVLLLAVLLVGCGAPAFSIISYDDKFADKEKPKVTVGENNRISTKSVGGGIHIDQKGIYLDPYVAKSRVSNEILVVGFYVNHFNHSISSGFNPINEVIIITDKNERIEMSVTDKGFDFDLGSWNPVSVSYNTAFSEGGVAETTLENFELLAKANWVEIKIVGGKQDEEYLKDEISDTFLLNIKNFYNSAIK